MLYVYEHICIQHRYKFTWVYLSMETLGTTNETSNMVVNISVVRSTVNHIQIKEHKDGSAPSSLDPNHLSAIWGLSAGWVFWGLRMSSFTMQQASPLGVVCTVRWKGCARRPCKTGQTDLWSAQVWCLGSTQLMQPFWLSFSSLLLAS